MERMEARYTSMVFYAFSNLRSVEQTCTGDKLYNRFIFLSCVTDISYSDYVLCYVDWNVYVIKYLDSIAVEKNQN